MASFHPSSLALVEPNQLQIEWTDSVIQRLDVRRLREVCPCATCREKRNAPAADATLLPVLTLAETKPLRIVSMKPVGNYAYGIHFSDGHDTGIFTLDFLRRIGDGEDRLSPNADR